MPPLLRLHPNNQDNTVSNRLPETLSETNDQAFIKDLSEISTEHPLSQHELKIHELESQKSDLTKKLSDNPNPKTGSQKREYKRVVRKIEVLEAEINRITKEIKRINGDNYHSQKFEATYNSEIASAIRKSGIASAIEATIGGIYNFFIGSANKETKFSSEKKTTKGTSPAAESEVKYMVRRAPGPDSGKDTTTTSSSRSSTSTTPTTTSSSPASTSSTSTFTTTIGSSSSPTTFSTTTNPDGSTTTTSRNIETTPATTGSAPTTTEVTTTTTTTPTTQPTTNSDGSSTTTHSSSTTVQLTTTPTTRATTTDTDATTPVSTTTSTSTPTTRAETTPTTTDTTATSTQPTTSTSSINTTSTTTTSPTTTTTSSNGTIRTTTTTTTTATSTFTEISSSSVPTTAASTNPSSASTSTIFNTTAKTTTETTTTASGETTTRTSTAFTITDGTTTDNLTIESTTTPSGETTTLPNGEALVNESNKKSATTKVLIGVSVAALVGLAVAMIAKKMRGTKASYDMENTAESISADDQGLLALTAKEAKSGLAIAVAKKLRELSQQGESIGDAVGLVQFSAENFHTILYLVGNSVKTKRGEAFNGAELSNEKSDAYNNYLARIKDQDSLQELIDTYNINKTGTEPELKLKTRQTEEETTVGEEASNYLDRLKESTKTYLDMLSEEQRLVHEKPIRPEERRAAFSHSPGKSPTPSQKSNASSAIREFSI